MSDLPPIQKPHPHVAVDDAIHSGSPIIVGSRVPVRRLWAWHVKGITIETLVLRYPSLGWAKVLDAISFAYDNQELMAADLAREARMLEEDRERIPGEGMQLKLELPRPSFSFSNPMCRRR